MRPDFKTWHFTVQGHGVSVDCAPVDADTEEHATREALKQCKRFTLPGWVLVCTETGGSTPVAQLFEHDAAGRKIKEFRA